MEGIQPSVSYKTLLETFELTRKELGEAEETIKRITGRDPDLFANGPGGPNKWKPNNRAVEAAAARKRNMPPFRKDRVEEIESVPPEEESPDEDETPTKKPSLQSTVVATPKDVKSRRATIQEQNVNSKVKARNRRMFGMILGTLQKFQHEAKKRKEQDLKRAEIEQKVEAAAAEEKERIKKEKEELFHTRKEKQIQLRCLEKKMEIAELHETWESNHKNLSNFIMTTAKPQIFYMPVSHNAESEKRLEESRNKTLELIQQRKDKMEMDISEVEELYKKDNFPSDKENIGPLENNESQNLQSEMDLELPVADVENTATIDTEERTDEKNIDILADQEFEPIYD